jgi:hypothetical protein
MLISTLHQNNLIDLCIDNPDLQLELTADGQLVSISPDAIKEDRDIVHTLDRHGEPFTYDLKDLYWNPKAYDYLKE